MRAVTMARKQKPEADAEPKDAGVYSLKIDPDLVTPLKMVAAGLGMTTPNYVNSRLRMIVDEELKRVIKAMEDRRTQGGK